MKVLVTGAAGYLGRGLIVPFEAHGYDLRLMDVKPFKSHHEVIAGDVTDLESVRRTVEGVDALIIAHMAPRDPDAYTTPVISFDINVKGTANLFFAAAEAGIKRVVVISSTGVVLGHKREIYPHDLRPSSEGIYCLTKVCQEMIAEQYQHEFGMRVAVLRAGSILDGDSMIDKYGTKVTEFDVLLSERRDIGEVARLCLKCSDLVYEVFHVVSTDEAMDTWDVRYTCERLDWKPKYNFKWLTNP